MGGEGCAKCNRAAKWSLGRAAQGAVRRKAANTIWTASSVSEEKQLYSCGVGEWAKREFCLPLEMERKTASRGGWTFLSLSWSVCVCSVRLETGLAL